MTARSRRRWRWLAVALLTLALVKVVSVVGPATVPGFREVMSGYRPSEALLLDRRGEVLDAERLDFTVRRLRWTPLDEISPALVSAVVEGEDREFWNHGPIDYRAVLGAARDRWLERRPRGASTISMQLASLLEGKRPDTGTASAWGRKLRQVRVACGLETHWTKAQVLEAYLNLLEYRGELQGIGAAAQFLAGKAPSGLSQPESLVIAALLPDPAAAPDRIASRACARALSSRTPVSCDAIRRSVETMLARAARPTESMRLAPQVARVLLRHPGESVRTTIDAATQRLAHDVLSRDLAQLESRNVRDGAVLVVDNASGDILAYVGSAGPRSSAPQVDGVRARRQAGSTLKPFLYELALELRYLTAASLLEDSPVNLETTSGVYIPQDYDHDFKGPVSVRTALGNSLNVPAVRGLVLVGVEPFRRRLHDLGYAGITHSGDYYGYSLALGSAEVSLWEQAQAYRTLARGGRFGALRLRSDEAASPEREPLAADASFIVGDILSDRGARVLTFGINNHLNTSFWSAAKTGTSKDMRDNWCVGFSQRFTVAVWVGNFEGDAMHDVSGVSGAAPVWRELMDALHNDGASPEPPAPAGVQRIVTRFAPAIEAPRDEWFLAGTQSHRITARSVADGIARIASPAHGMIIAIDPDIPDAQQRVVLTAEGGTSDLVMALNGVVVGPASRPFLWAPQVGAQRLALQTPEGRVLDQVLFTVR